jgi:hypothetical protein
VNFEREYGAGSQEKSKIRVAEAELASVKTTLSQLYTKIYITSTAILLLSVMIDLDIGLVACKSHPNNDGNGSTGNSSTSEIPGLRKSL